MALTCPEMARERSQVANAIAPAVASGGTALKKYAATGTPSSRRSTMAEGKSETSG
jgi:hypothetical protein